MKENQYHIAYVTKATDLKGLSNFLDAVYIALTPDKYQIKKPMRFSYPEEGKIRVDIEYQKGDSV